LVAQYLWHSRVFGNVLSALYIVFGWVGFIAGLILACARFISGPSLWTFINLIVEPIDSALLALVASYIVYHLTIRNQLIKQIP
jgi:hypothetical protein